MSKPKVAYLISSPLAASYPVGQMILPQLEAGARRVDVVGMFFFADNIYALRGGHPLGERLGIIARVPPHDVRCLRPGTGTGRRRTQVVHP